MYTCVIITEMVKYRSSFKYGSKAVELKWALRFFGPNRRPKFGRGLEDIKTMSQCFSVQLEISIISKHIMFWTLNIKIFILNCVRGEGGVKNSFWNWFFLVIVSYTKPQFSLAWNFGGWVWVVNLFLCSA